MLGSSIGNPQDALNIARRALALGLKSTVGIIHDHSGQLLPLTEEQQKVHEEILALNKPVYTEALYNQFQKNLNRGLPNDWHCTAGSRYLYICEDGLVHYCSQQRGHPGIPLEQYTQENLQREYKTVKPCAPYCTISCVQRVAMVDYLREKPLEAVQRFFPAESEHNPLGDRPMLVNVLCWLLLPSKPGEKKLLQKMALRLLRVK